MTVDRALGRLRAIRGLSPREWGLFAEATLANFVMPLAARRIPLGRLVPRLERAAGRAPRRRRLTADRAAALIEISGIRLLGATCLTKALALYWLAGRQGVEVELGMSARPSGARLDAHAWIRHDGRIVLGGPIRPDFETVWRTSPSMTLRRGMR